MPNLLINQIDIHAENYALRKATPQEILKWALALNQKTIATTSFGPGSAALLHLLAYAKGGEEVPVIWIDSGFNVTEAYKVAEKIMSKLNLNMHIEVPDTTAARLQAIYGEIPTRGEAFDEFVKMVKLDPFQNAINKFEPQVWINGIHHSDTAYRKNLDILSIDKRGILKVAPLFYWDKRRTMEYVRRYDLPTCEKYFDPTKPNQDIECGLHLETIPA